MSHSGALAAARLECGARGAAGAPRIGKMSGCNSQGSPAAQLRRRGLRRSPQRATPPHTLEASALKEGRTRCQERRPAASGSCSCPGVPRVPELELSASQQDSTRRAQVPVT